VNGQRAASAAEHEAGDLTWTPALLTSAGPDSSVTCRLCPFRCVLPEGRTGMCAVRANHAGRPVTAARTVAVAHLDAVERKPLFHVLPGRPVLTVAGPGCTFRCTYCINHRLSQYGRERDSLWRGEPADATALARHAHQVGAVLGMSYTEPSLAIELAVDLAQAAAPLGVPLLWKSNGFLTPEAVDVVAPLLTAVNIDVKAADDDTHRRLTGAPLGPVLDTVGRLRAAGVWVEVSTPLVPGTSDRPHQLAAIAARIAAIDPDIPWHPARFSPDHRMTRPAPTTPQTLGEAVTIGRAAGLRYVYVERALGPAGRRTVCTSCGQALVERDVWALAASALDDGACPTCRTPVPGIWR
jgi:pyruvate formate lyase activating enzyme